MLPSLCMDVTGMRSLGKCCVSSSRPFVNPRPPSWYFRRHSTCLGGLGRYGRVGGAETRGVYLESQGTGGFGLTHNALALARTRRRTKRRDEKGHRQN